jgi:hypothetical protein
VFTVTFNSRGGDQFMQQWAHLNARFLCCTMDSIIKKPPRLSLSNSGPISARFFFSTEVYTRGCH